MSTQKGIVPALVIILVAIAAGIGGYLVYQQYQTTPTLPTPPQVACTADAKLCPDGTSVGRTDPNCEFAPCPDESTSSADSKPIIQSSLNKGWNIFTGKSTIYPYQPIFSIEYPNNWEVEDYLLYPFGKTHSNQNPTINLRAGGHGGYTNLKIITRNFPAGTARYSWGQPKNLDYIAGFASFYKDGEHLIQVSHIPLDKEQEIRSAFDQILSTFKFIE